MAKWLRCLTGKALPLEIALQLLAQTLWHSSGADQQMQLCARRYQLTQY